MTNETNIANETNKNKESKKTKTLTDKIKEKGEEITKPTAAKIMISGKHEIDDDDNVAVDEKNKNKEEIVEKEDNKQIESVAMTENVQRTEKTTMALSNQYNIPESLLSDDKTKVEDTHKRTTFLIRKDILQELNDFAKKKRHGYKTEFINFAIQRALAELKEIERKKELERKSNK